VAPYREKCFLIKDIGLFLIKGEFNMKYIDMKNGGAPSVLAIAEMPIPKLKKGEVLIKVHASGVNRPDCLQRLGHYPPPADASPILGLEVSGVIIESSEGTSLFKVGDHVCALVNGGGYAEYVVAPEGQCLLVPDGFNFIEAAALPETFFTVWSNIFEDGRLAHGESILIHGGTGGIGTTAIQMAHNLGAKVFTTVGKKDSVEVCKKLGADEVILYKEDNFAEEIKKRTEGKGVNVILDIIGKDYFQKNLDSLSYQGRLIQLAALSGSQVTFDLMEVMKKRITITGSTLRPKSSEEKSRIARALEKNIWPMLSAGIIKPLIYKTFPLKDAALAHAIMESSKHTGKIVLTI
jgi:NADPH2:quinone reductase